MNYATWRFTLRRKLHSFSMPIKQLDAEPVSCYRNHAVTYSILLKPEANWNHKHCAKSTNILTVATCKWGERALAHKLTETLSCNIAKLARLVRKYFCFHMVHAFPNPVTRNSAGLHKWNAYWHWLTLLIPFQATRLTFKRSIFKYPQLCLSNYDWSGGEGASKVWIGR